MPSGSALAVDRDQFAQHVTQKIENHPNIELIRVEISTIPDTPTIIATGPLTSPALTEQIQQLSGQEYLYFFDALSPIVELETVDMNVAFRASRYDKGEQEEGDYINWPDDRSGV